MNSKQATDVVIDGATASTSIRRAHALKAKGQTYLDIETSSGVSGLERGYCLMVGGEGDAFDRIDPLLESLAPAPCVRADRNSPTPERSKATFT
ncbi:MAG: NAD(P)-binding domain-containing protein [Ensifer adhaerens]